MIERVRKLAFLFFLTFLPIYIEQRRKNTQKSTQYTNMFDAVHEQLHHQFIASSRTSSQLPLPPSSSNFPLHSSLVSSFDAYSNQLLLNQPHFINPILHQQSHHISNSHKVEEIENNLVPINLDIIESERRSSSSSIQEVSINNNIDDDDDDTTPWSNEEVLALFKIRSNMENWFPQFTWDNVSRKLSQLGFKRSGEKCKEKFEEENRYFNGITNLSKNYRIQSDLQELYQTSEQNQKVIENPRDYQGQAKRDESTFEKSNQTIIGKDFEGNDDDEIKVMEMTQMETKNRKRKKQNKFEILLKCFCEDVVKKMMVQQEEIHNKLIEDMVKRDKEKVEKEEALKTQEMNRMNKEFEIMVKEQALAIDRQASIIELLKKFTPSTNERDFNINIILNKVRENSNSSNSLAPFSLIHQTQNLNPSCDHKELNFTSNCTQNYDNDKTLLSQSPNSIIAQNKIPKLPFSPKTTKACQNPSSFNTQKTTITPTSPSIHKEDIAKRWPRDEVLALINLRSSICSEEKDGVKAPLWERISQGMFNLGYERSSKRCKEKWENINKYFRKTKDISKKRSIDSRTCPYFHILSTLYNQGALDASHQEGQENCLASSDQNLHCPQLGSSYSSMHNIDHEGERNLVVQVPSIASDFEF